MGKNKLVLASLGMGLSCLVFFQNCGNNNKTSAANNNKINSLDNNFKQSKSVYASVGEEVVLEAPANSYSQFQTEGTCEWTFTDSDKKVTPITNPSATLTLMNVKKAQSGIYLLHCENSTKVHDIEFKLTVDGGTTTTDEKTYKGYAIFNKKSKLFADKDDYTRAKALKACKDKHEDIKKYKGIKCLWGTETILTVAEPKNAKADLKIYTLGSDKKYDLKKTTKDIKLAAALTDCKAFAKKESPAVKCTWAGEEIAKYAADKATVAKHDLKVCHYAGGGCKSFKDLTSAQAATKCVQQGNSYGVYAGYRCTWNNDVIGQKQPQTIGGHN